MSGIPRTEYPRWQFWTLLDSERLLFLACGLEDEGDTFRRVTQIIIGMHRSEPWYHGKTWWMPQKTRLLCAVQDQVACGGSRSATGYSVSGRICCSISLQPSSKLRPVVRHLVASSLAKLVYNSNNLGLWLIYLYIFYRFPIWFINIYKLAYNWGCTTFLGGDAGVDVFLEPPCRNWTTAWVVADRLEELDELTYLKPSCILKDSWLRIGRTWCLWNSWQLYYWIARW